MGTGPSKSKSAAVRAASDSCAWRRPPANRLASDCTLPPPCCAVTPAERVSIQALFKVRAKVVAWQAATAGHHHAPFSATPAGLDQQE